MPSQGFSSVQSLTRIRLLMTPWTAARQASLSITNSQSLLKLMSTESVMPSKHLICCPLLLPPSIFPSIRVFSNESTLRIRWPKYWSFSFSISPSNGHPGLISFRMDWLDLLVVQGTLKSLLQHHSSKASILLLSRFVGTHSWRLCAWMAPYKDPSHTGLGPSLMRSRHLNYLSEGHVSKSSHILKYHKLRLKHRNFNGGTQIRPLPSLCACEYVLYLFTYLSKYSISTQRK